MTILPNRFAFSAGKTGNWRITSVSPVIGDPLASAPRLSLQPVTQSPTVVPIAVNSDPAPLEDAAWELHGVISNLRYATGSELTALRKVQEPLGRPAARRAALIPIRKNPGWWALAQDERRRIFEETSHHTAIGLDYLPAVSRQLFHCRDLAQPFDFLTWFEFAPDHETAFDELLGKLRSTAEWTYVEREVDVRLELA